MQKAVYVSREDPRESGKNACEAGSGAAKRVAVQRQCAKPVRRVFGIVQRRSDVWRVVEEKAPAGEMASAWQESLGGMLHVVEKNRNGGQVLVATAEGSGSSVTMNCLSQRGCPPGSLACSVSTV